MSQVLELSVQAQLRLEDGTVVLLTTPVLCPSENSTIEDIKNVLMSLGEDAQQKVARERSYNSGIIRASNLPPKIKLATDN